MRRLFAAREAGVLLALLVLCTGLSIASPYFFTLRNVFNVLQGMSTIGIMAIGDDDRADRRRSGPLGRVGARCRRGVDRPPDDLRRAQSVDRRCGGLMAGVAIGVVNGLLVTRARIVPFIATLGTLGVARGLAFVLATGAAGTVASNVPMRDAGVAYLGAGYVGPVPVPVLIMLALVVLSAALLANTVLGRQIYAVGSNARAARLSGISRRAGATHHLRDLRRTCRARRHRHDGIAGDRVDQPRTGRRARRHRGGRHRRHEPAGGRRAP